MSSQSVENFVNDVAHLPAAPTVVTELLPLFNDPDRDLDRVVELIAHDPSITAEVLKCCNSAFYATGSEVTDMFDAVMRLGFYETYRLVVAVFGSNATNSVDPRSGVDPALLWNHSITTAIASEVIAKRAGLEAATAFTAGLLHDLGKLVLASGAPEPYRGLVSASGCGGEALRTGEREQFGFDHAEVGGCLLEKWQLPEDVVAAVRFHHCAEDFEACPQLPAAVRLADAIAWAMSDDNASSVTVDGESLLNLSSEDAGSLIEATSAGLEKVKDLFNLRATAAA